MLHLLIELTKIENLKSEYYTIEQILNDSIANIYYVKNNNKYYLDTTGCKMKRKFQNKSVKIYLGKENEISQSEEKTSTQISAYYSTSTVHFSLSDIFLCPPKNKNNFTKRMSGSLILEGKQREVFNFCLNPIDTISLLENFKTYERFNLFKLMLKNR